MRPWLTTRRRSRANELIALPQPDQRRPHRRAHVARVEAHPGHRLHRHRLRRGLPALPGHGPPHRRRHAGRGDRPAGPGAGLPGRHLLPVVDRQLRPARAQDLRPARPRPRHARAASSPILDFWDRAARAYRGDDGTRQAWDTGTATPYDAGDRRRAPRRRRPRSATRRPAAHLPVQRHAGQLPVPALLRHPGRLRRHRPVRRCPATRTARCSCATSTGSGRATSGGATSAPTSRTTNLTAAYVLEGGSFRVTDFGTSNHTPEDYLDRLVGFGLFTTDGCAPGELRPVPDDELDGIVAAVRTAQAAALPQHRGHGPDGEDPLRRLRVLHLPAALRRGRRASPTSSTGRCPATCPNRVVEFLAAM